MAKAGMHTGQAAGVGLPGPGRQVSPDDHSSRALDPRSVIHATFANDGHTVGVPIAPFHDAHPQQAHTGPESNESDAGGLHRHGTGVGIYPQETSDAMEMPGVGFGHMRRGSERWA